MDDSSDEDIGTGLFDEPSGATTPGKKAAQKSGGYWLY
jgi:hypothetical protein